MELVIGKIKIEVTFKDIKNVHLSVHPPFGNVTLSSPAENSIEKIDGYFLPRPNESRDAAFERAKRELLSNLQRQIDVCASITAERYFYHK